MTLGDRITERLEALGGLPSGYSQAWLAREVGVTQPAINNLVKKPDARSKHLHRIARALQTTPEYLLGETDDPAVGAVPMPSTADIANQLDAVMLPEVEVSYSMGGGSVVDDWPVVRMVPFSRTWLRGLSHSAPSELLVARGDGDSMMPTILDQDLVIIDRGDQTPKQQDRIWAMSYGGLGMIKRLRQLPDGTIQINSDNKDVPPIHAVDGEVHIIGRVVGVIRRI